MEKDLVSVIIPTYNRAHLLKKTIESVQSQSYPHWELIVVDDGSSDNTKGLMEEIMRLDGRIIYKRLELNRGANHCRNLGLRLAEGDYVNFLDSDDFFKTDKLQKQMRVFSEFPQADIVLCPSQVILPDASTVPAYTPIESSEGTMVENYITKKIAWPTLCPLWRKSFLDRVGFFNEDLTNSQEFEFTVRALCRHPNIRFLSEALCYVSDDKSDPVRIHNTFKNNKTHKGINIASLQSKILSRIFVERTVKENNMFSWKLRRYFVKFYGSFFKQVFRDHPFMISINLFYFFLRKRYLNA